MAAGALLLSMWVFFSYGGNVSKPLTVMEQEVLKVRDKRLTKGNPDAPVKVVEYADILCPFCAKVNGEVMPQIESNYIDKRQVHYEVRLVAMIAPDSERAAHGAYCAAEQNKFWQYIDTAYKDTWSKYYSKDKGPEDVQMFNEKNISSFARQVGLTIWQWQECMDSRKYAETMTQNKQKMSEIEAYGTPHFIINGSNYNGAPPFSSFKAVIGAELNKDKAGQ